MARVAVARLDFDDRDAVPLRKDEVKLLTALLVVVVQRYAALDQLRGHKILRQRPFIDVYLAVEHRKLDVFQAHAAQKAGIEYKEFIEVPLLRERKREFERADIEREIGYARIRQPLRGVAELALRGPLLQIGQHETFVFLAELLGNGVEHPLGQMLFGTGVFGNIVAVAV